jgi:long-chain acyl-CoA synthetase
MPMSHIYGVTLMGVSIWSGAKQILLERFDLETVVRLIQEHGVTWLFAVPPVLLALANAPGLESSQFRTIKYAFSAAAPLPLDVARRVEARFGFRIVQGYGLTEASPATHNNPLDPDRIKLGSGGPPVADTEHRIVDVETGQRTLAPGEVGEIVVRGPQVMQGYWNAPEETARALRNGWLYTGDIGWVDEEGYIYIVDRKKEMIKYKSFSIAPAELEAVLLEHPEVADCAVTSVEDAEAGQVPKAFVVPRAKGRIDMDALARFVAERVAGYKQIRHFEVIDAIPRTPSGKILRRLLK